MKKVNIHTISPVVNARHEPAYFIDKARKIEGDAIKSKFELMLELTTQYGEKLFRKAKDGGLNLKSWGVNASKETLAKAASDLGITVSLGMEVATIQRGINATNASNNGLASFQSAFWPEYAAAKAGKTKAEPKEVEEVLPEQIALMEAGKAVTQAKIEVLQAESKEEKAAAKEKLDDARVVANLAKAELDNAKLEAKKLDEWANFTGELSALVTKFSDSKDESTSTLARRIAELLH